MYIGVKKEKVIYFIREDIGPDLVELATTLKVLYNKSFDEIMKEYGYKSFKDIHKQDANHYKTYEKLEAEMQRLRQIIK